MEGEFFPPLPSARHRGEPVENILCVLKQIGIPIGIAVAVVSNSKNQVLFCFRHSERDVGFFFDFHIFFLFLNNAKILLILIVSKFITIFFDTAHKKTHHPPLKKKERTRTITVSALEVLQIKDVVYNLRMYDTAKIHINTHSKNKKMNYIQYSTFAIYKLAKPHKYAPKKNTSSHALSNFAVSAVNRCEHF